MEKTLIFVDIMAVQRTPPDLPPAENKAEINMETNMKSKKITIPKNHGIWKLEI